MAFLADSIERVRTLLKIAKEVAAVVKLAINPKKCASLHLQGRGENSVLPTAFTIEGQ